MVGGVVGRRERLILASGSARRGRSRGETPEDVLSFWFGRRPGPRFGPLDAAWLPTRIPCWGGHWANRLFDVDGIVMLSVSVSYMPGGALATWMIGAEPHRKGWRW